MTQRGLSGPKQKTKNKKNSFKSETVVVEMKAGLTNQINPCRPEAESDFFVLS